MERVVMGIVDTPAQAEATVERLRSVGFSPDDVSVLFSDKRGPHDFAFEHRTKAPEGAVTGAGLGAIVGSLLGIAAGVGVLVVPGLGALVASGPALAALSSAAVFALLAGIIGAIAGARIPEIEAKHYAGKLSTGSVLVAVHASGRDAASRARMVFRSVAASDVTSTTEAALPLGARV